ncbi:hypothetical protein K8R43_06005 [archaeon]|nr:hypothetical protein [archaeon]
MSFLKRKSWVYLALLIVVIGCINNEDNGANGNNIGESKTYENLSPEDALVKSPEVSENVGSFTFEGEYYVKVDFAYKYDRQRGQSRLGGEYSIKGECDKENDAVKLIYEYPNTNLGYPITMEEYGIGTMSYMKNYDGAWYITEKTSEKDTVLKNQLDLMRGASIEESKETSFDGKQVYVYVLKPNIDNIRDYFNLCDSTNNEDEPESYKRKCEMVNSLDDFDEYEFKAWVNKKTLFLEKSLVHARLEKRNSQENFTLESDVELVFEETPVSIVLPAEAENGKSS